jgi:hypothetical protein
VYADPAVVRRKVEREIAGYFERQDHYRSRGIWVLQYACPQLLVAFVAPMFKPHPIAAFGVLVDMSNYDVEPPSLQFVNPFTREPLAFKEVPTRLTRVRLENVQAQLPPRVELPPGVQQALIQQVQHHDALLQGSDQEPAFMCLQGVREYHENPAHTGDPWWLYRSKGAGSLLRLLDVISRFGTEAMREQQFQLQFVPSGIRAEFPTEPA